MSKFGLLGVNLENATLCLQLPLKQHPLYLFGICVFVESISCPLKQNTIHVKIEHWSTIFWLMKIRSGTWHFPFTIEHLHSFVLSNTKLDHILPVMCLNVIERLRSFPQNDKQLAFKLSKLWPLQHVFTFFRSQFCHVRPIFNNEYYFLNKMFTYLFTVYFNGNM